MSLPMFVIPILCPFLRGRQLLLNTTPLAAATATPRGVIDFQASVSESSDTNLRKFLHHARTVVKGFLTMPHSKMAG